MRRDTIIDHDGGTEPFRAAQEAFRLWTEGARGAEKVLTKAARRSAEETRAVFDALEIVGRHAGAP